MTWDDIKTKYPNQYVALKNVYPDKYDIQTADVLHTEEDMSASDIIAGAMDGKWIAVGTNIDTEYPGGVQL